jgi:stage III sporulation protein SpoIIIAA
VFVFSEETHQLFLDYPGLAGVRVVTSVGGAQVASALLERETLSDVLWRRSLNIAGKARRDGTERVTLLQDLVRWGEDRTEYEYNPRYTRRR